ncbi:MAG: DUF4153 domain-containing protein, partial [Candidatus Eisenbacteria bacterium]|nr:DUF4153 domain-containing protein [Candidatus Eisenbacteria bacterium]
RIGQYGVTEERYDLFALAAWVTLVAVGYSWRRRADIRWIPMSLCAVALLTSFGPWGAYSVSRLDQTKRVLALIAELGVKPDGTPSNAARLDFDARKKLSDGVRYLAGTHGVASLPAALRAAAERDSAWRKLGDGQRNDGERTAQAVMTGLGQGYVTRWDKAEIRRFEFRADNGAPEEESIVGFDRLVQLKDFPLREFGPESRGVRVKFDSRSRLLTLEDRKGGRWTFSFDSLITARIESGPAAGARVQNALRLEPVPGTSRARFLLRELNGQQQADTITVHRFDADVLLGK